MNLSDRIFSQPGLQDSPPVLVDVGASGGAHRLWRRIARHAVWLGFEPDQRETAALDPDRRRFRRWIFSDKLVVADGSAATTTLHLTRYPHCSSTLKPDEAALAEWSFAELFEVINSRECPAATLADVLRQHGLEHLDWLKCDTQGTDFRIFQSLSPEQRSRVLVVEFEPGIVDAYQGEDKFASMLTANELEPFWLVRLDVHGTPWGRPADLRRRLGRLGARAYRVFGPTAPGWVNAVYMRRYSAGDHLGVREYLLGWVFACLLGQPAYALEIAETGEKKFGDPLFPELARAAARRMKWSILKSWRQWPEFFWRKLTAG